MLKSQLESIPGELLRELLGTFWSPWQISDPGRWRNWIKQEYICPQLAVEVLVEIGSHLLLENVSGGPGVPYTGVNIVI